MSTERVGAGRRARPAPEDPQQQATVLSAWSPPSAALAGALAAGTPAGFRVALDALRREKGLTYARLERRARGVPGISRSSAHAMLTGQRDLTAHRVSALLHLCGVPAHERDQWLTGLARLQAPEPPASEEPVVYSSPPPPPPPEPVAAADDDRGADAVEPDPPRPRRGSGRDEVHGGLPRLLAALALAPAGAIALARWGVPVPVMLGCCTAAAVGIALWTVGRTAEVDRPHVRKVWLDSAPFPEPPRAARPVIGDDR
ncbi:helix-turn-helix domain-containing protein [Saccharothrix syringae]|uniref:XRE family transcriptional regulator n=1 Tax=Saccharothrix syringae TaxID=103733 RepID=A0A5Q0H3L6_SACSY|nr:helix-turn-helix transcriptional regulator [Saccharothrix syringae]QFZ20312.1 XRE family transcriptional regulator [Saccharothrix syringae]